VLVRVRLFAQLRERAGARELELELPDGARVADALAAVEELAAGLPLVLAVNREYAPEDRLLVAGDELALVPPVSGGAALIHARVTGEPLSLDAVGALVRDPRAGAVVVFCGVTRDVQRLEYEAYAEMAEPEIARIAGVSAPHRGEAFAGARDVIDAIKARAPIWKREHDGGEATWVTGKPPPASA